MGFSPNVQAAFDNWLNCSTWHTSHAQDEGRFFQFVWAAVHNQANEVPESVVEQAIMERWRGKIEAVFLEQKSIEAASLYRTLLDFWEARPTR